jgi:hypothetical protein
VTQDVKDATGPEAEESLDVVKVVVDPWGSLKE